MATLLAALVVGALVIGSVAAAALVLAPRMRMDRVVFDTTPDAPVEFGYSMSWLALRTSDTADVVQTLRLGEPVACNWSSGIGTAYDDELGAHRVFVSPPVDGWTFVVGLSLPHPVSPRFVDKATPQLLRLSARYGDAQYYMSYPMIDLFAWSRATNGKLVRAFAIAENGIITNKGRTSQEERALGLKLFELRGVKARHGDLGSELLLFPTEEHVMRIARQWSLDPSAFNGIAPPRTGQQTGYVGLAPHEWRSELQRKSAA